MPVLKRKFDGKGNVSHIDVLGETKVGKEWHPSDRVVQSGLVDGWMSIADGKLTVKTAPGKPDHVFKILNPPGVFCCHCGSKLDAGDDVAKQHLLDEHASDSGFELVVGSGEDERKGKVARSPDRENPAGYRQDNFHRLKRVK